MTARVGQIDYRRQGGELVIADPGSDRPLVECGTVKCCHCATSSGSNARSPATASRDSGRQTRPTCSAAAWKSPSWVAAYRCAAAILNEHPADDDEPVTEEWLVSVGFENHRIKLGWGFTLCVIPGVSTDLEYECGASMSYDHASGNAMLPDCDTRGQVRSLCKALGINLKEPEGTGMKFRKKPVVIEAVQYTGKNHREIYEFTNGVARKTSQGVVVIETLEGDLIVSVNDWVIRGVSGEYYPCKPDIFEKTYEREENTPACQVCGLRDVGGAVCPSCGNQAAVPEREKGVDA